MKSPNWLQYTASSTVDEQRKTYHFLNIMEADVEALPTEFLTVGRG